MRLLFFDGASGCQLDTEGNLYTAGNLTHSIMGRYRRYCSELSIILIEDEKVYSVSEARAKFDAVDASLAEIVAVPKYRSTRIDFFNLALRKRVTETIAEAIRRADKVIIRAPGRFYTNTALKLCRKYHKPYLIESVDFVFEFMSMGRLSKVFAPYGEITCRREIARAPYVVYVTQEALQKRYPSSGRTLGCSDVELLDSESLRRTTHGGGGMVITVA